MPAFPQNDALRQMWEYWQEISYTRRNYGWGVTPLNYTEISAWAQLRGIRLDGWELDTLIRLDAVYLDVEAKAEARRRATNGGS